MTQSQADFFANELTIAVPAVSSPTTQAMGAAPTSLLGAVIDLVDALRTSDWKRVGQDVKAIINILIPDDPQPANLRASAMAAGFDWNKLIQIILQILPLILNA